MNSTGNKNLLGVFSLTMINVAAIMSLRNFPMMAHVGWASVFFYIIAGFGFFIPAALVSAELATGWPSRGGVYTWVKEAFGEQFGFIAIWMQWINNVIWYPTVLSFMAVTISYAIDPALGENRVYILLTVLITFWTCTLINLLGMKASSMISSIGVIIGVFIPSAIIILLGITWLIMGKPNHIPFTPGALLPQADGMDNIVFLVGVFLGLCGIEMSAVHAKEVTNPQKNYPRAIFFSTLIILGLSVLGSLAISFVIPPREITLVAGTMQAFSAFFKAYDVEWLMPIIALCITLGPLAAVTTWIVGPCKALFQTSEEGYIPPFFHKRNKHGMPVNILIVQGMIVTVMCLAYFLMPTVNSAYWILNVLTSLLYLIMYILLFSAAITLRYKHPDVKRTYRVPYIWLVGGIGFISSVSAFCIGFIPPEHVEPSELLTFRLILVIGVGTMLIIPLVLYSLRRESWRNL